MTGCCDLKSLKAALPHVSQNLGRPELMAIRLEKARVIATSGRTLRITSGCRNWTANGGVNVNPDVVKHVGKPSKQMQRMPIGNVVGFMGKDGEEAQLPMAPIIAKNKPESTYYPNYTQVLPDPAEYNSIGKYPVESIQAVLDSAKAVNAETVQLFVHKDISEKQPLVFIDCNKVSDYEGFSLAMPLRK